MSLLLSILLFWNCNQEPEITGYKLHWYTTDSSELNYNKPFIFTLDVGNNSNVQFPVTENVFYYFVVTAYTKDGLESDYSNEIFTINIP